MDVRRLTVAIALAGAAATAGGFAAVSCSTDARPRPPLSLPDVARFAAGPCGPITDPVLALGRFTYDKADANRLGDGDRAELVRLGQSLIAARKGAQPALAKRMTEVVKAIAMVRVRVGDRYDRQLLADVETARLALQNDCLSAAVPVSPTRGA
jgi:hypothetical protein